MENVEELKDVLEKIENKLVVVRLVRVAIAFVYWSTVLSAFYLIMSIAGRLSEAVVLIFWLLAVALFYPFWCRAKKLLGLKFRDFAVIAAPLVLVIILSFYVIGYVETLTGSWQNALGVTLLCLVSLYLLLVALVIRAKFGRFPREILPAIMSFLFAPLVPTVSYPLAFVGYVIMTTYGITALICLVEAISS